MMMTFCNPKWFGKNNLQMLLAIFGMMLMFSTIGSSLKLPRFAAADCRVFRERLSKHTWESFYDRRHAVRLGIASIALFLTGIPGIPLGIAAIWLGHRIETNSLEEMISSGVTEDNWKDVNTLCGRLLKERALTDVSFDGKSYRAIILGGLGIGLSLLVLIAQGSFGFLFCCFRGKSKINGKDANEVSDGTGDTRRV